ncbi:MAG: electron transport complex subunit E [Nitrosomonadales bacterium]|nr:electron transport complex subunit E [Nitrosomonadales bacterium]
MTYQEFKDIFYNGLWKQNTGVVQLLGLCPILAVSSSVVNGVSLGIATAVVMALSGAAIAPIRNVVPNEARIPVFILIIAVLVTVVQYAMNAYMYTLYVVLGIFIPLIVTNCIVLARIEAFASKQPPLQSATDGFAMGLGLTAVLAILGGVRELFGHGTLLSGIDMVFGATAKSWVITVVPGYHGFLLAILPPGAFVTLGLLIALKNWINLRAEQKKSQRSIAILPATAG